MFCHFVVMFEIELLNFVETSKEIVEFYSLSAVSLLHARKEHA